MARRTRGSKSSPDKNAFDEIEGQNIPLNIFKDLLKFQETTIQSFFRSLADSVNARIDNIIKDVRDLKCSLEFTQGQVNDLLKINCDKKISEIQEDIVKLLEKTDDLENRSRRNNLCFDGISESPNDKESWEQSETKLRKLISEKMELDASTIDIERAHRVGQKNSSGKPRTIIAKFLSYKDRELVFKAKRKLKGSGVFVREDFSDRVAEKRKQLIPEMTEARRNGKKAFIRFDKLIVYDSFNSPPYISNLSDAHGKVSAAPSGVNMQSYPSFPPPGVYVQSNVRFPGPRFPGPPPIQDTYAAPTS